MTLIVAAGNAKYVVLVSDRRLTAKGILRDDESNKAITLWTSGARLGVAYTGLAELGPFRTAEWLPTRLQSALQPNGAIDLLEFCRGATSDFSRLSVADASDRLLSIVLAGFVVREGESEPRLVRSFIGNGEIHSEDGSLHTETFQVQDLQFFGEGENDASFAVVGGAIGPRYERDREAISKMVAEGLPPEAIVGKAVELIQSGAATDNRIGTQCSSLVIERNGRQRAAYHTGETGNATYLPAIVTRKQVFLGARIERIGAGRPLAVKRVRPDAPCPCKSGLKYRLCHALPPKRGIQPTIRVTAEGDIEVQIGEHKMTSDSEAFTFELRDEDLPRTRVEHPPKAD